MALQNNQPTLGLEWVCDKGNCTPAAASAPGSMRGTRLDILSTGSYKASRSLRRSSRVTGQKLATLQARAASRLYDTSKPILGIQSGSKD